MFSAFIFSGSPCRRGPHARRPAVRGDRRPLEANLSTFNDDYDARHPGRNLQQVEARLFGVPQQAAAPGRDVWNSIFFWRCLAAVSLVITSAALSLTVATVSP